MCCFLHQFKIFRCKPLDIYIYKSKSATNDLSSNNTTVICVLIVLPVTAFDSSHFFSNLACARCAKKEKINKMCQSETHTFASEYQSAVVSPSDC